MITNYHLSENNPFLLNQCYLLQKDEIYVSNDYYVIDDNMPYFTNIDKKLIAESTSFVVDFNLYVWPKT